MTYRMLTPGTLAWMQRRVTVDFIHTYTRLPRGVAQDDPDTPDDDESIDVYGGANYPTGESAPAPVTGQPCFYSERGRTMEFTPEGPMNENRPAIYVPPTDPIKVGDRIRDVTLTWTGPDGLTHSRVLLEGPETVGDILVAIPEGTGPFWIRASLRTRVQI